MDFIIPPVEPKSMDVLKLEIDYELMNLFDAMQTNEENKILNAKETLKRLHAEMEKLKATV